MRLFTRPPVWGVRGMPREHNEKAGFLPGCSSKVIYPSGVRGRWVVVLVAVVAAAGLAVVLATRGSPTDRPTQLTPSQHVSDDADLIRRLERHQLVQRPN